MFGVIAMLCFFVFVVSTMIWWVLVECDACQLEATGLGDDDSGCALMANPLTWGCCRLFSQLLLAICLGRLQHMVSPHHWLFCHGYYIFKSLSPSPSVLTIVIHA